MLVNRLQQEGYEAKRRTLFDSGLPSFHTLVSVKLDGRDFMLDNISMDRPPSFMSAFAEKPTRSSR